MKKNSKKTFPRKRAPKNVRAAALIRRRSGNGSRTAGRGCRRGPAMDGEGRFIGTRYGYGFCDVGDARYGEIFLPAAKTMGAMDGDRVRISYRPSPDRPGRAEGEVTAILEDGDYRLIGTLCAERVRGERNGREFFVLPSSPHLPERIPVDDPAMAKNGDKVAVLLPRRRYASGTVVQCFGSAADLSANYASILAEEGVPTDFDPDVLAEAEEAARRPLSGDGRVRRTECLFTMDGEDAKDLDDAVSLSRDERGWHLGVHIADVSEYVLPRTRLWDAAMERGTSLYFADRVVPMLPQSLSNGACSLNAGEDKYVLSALITLTPDGEIAETVLEKGIARSRVRGVYREVNDVLAAGDASPFYDKYREVYPSLLLMRELYEILVENSRARGSMELEETEAVIALDENGTPTAVIPRTRGIAEKMIEQFMLAANRAVATLLCEAEIPCVYRVHDCPPKERLADFAIYAHNLGLCASALTGKAGVSAADFSRLLAEAEEKGIRDAVTSPLLRAMAKAKYDERPAPHFGLSVPLYCHFTSPIRRLSDLVTHRVIKAVLLGGEPAVRYRRTVARAAEAATETELRALSAERAIEALYKTMYLHAHEGETVRARISSVTSFGFFAVLPDTCEGLVPIESLPGVFTFEEETLSLVSRDRTYRIADEVTVTIGHADLAARRTYFSVAEEEGTD